MTFLPTVHFENVSKRFDFSTDEPQSVLETIISVFTRERDGRNRTLWAVDDISFDLMPGECLGLVGRNGSGKSTLLKLTAGIIRPTSGRVEVRGRLSALLELGAGFHADLTGRENIWLNGSILGLSKREIEESYHSIVDFSELGDFIHMPVKHYSSGMYMRLGFSVAVHVNPDVLLVDEILAVGDRSFQDKCVNRLHDLKARGTSVIYVSHSLDTVRSLCSRVMWIENGAVQASGPTDELIEKYLDSHGAHYGEADATKPSVFQRWGTREIEIKDVRLLSAGGRIQEEFTVAEALTVEIHYFANATVEDPTFGLAFFRQDGVFVSGPDNHFSGLKLGKIRGEGVVRCHIDRLPLLPALYNITAAVYDATGMNAFDVHDKAYTLRVVDDSARNRRGVVEMATTWEMG